MKTAMQEFFMVIKEFNKELYNTMYNEGILDTAIEKEKEQIIDTYKTSGLATCTKGTINIDGTISDIGNYKIMTSEEYYNQTYNPNKCFNCGDDKADYALYCEFCRKQI